MTENRGSSTIQPLKTDLNAFAESSYVSPALLKKTKGFVDFDLQLFRPEVKKSNCHEKRLESFNYFPPSLSNYT
jgi:hypothetical protein